MVVGFGNIKSIIVRTSLQWLKDALMRHMELALMKVSCYVRREAKKRTRTVVHGDSFGSVATDLLVISGFSAQ